MYESMISLERDERDRKKKEKLADGMACAYRLCYKLPEEVTFCLESAIGLAVVMTMHDEPSRNRTTNTGLVMTIARY